MQYLKQMTRYLPKPIRNILWHGAKFYFSRRGYPLAGSLAGFSMRSEFIKEYFDGTYEAAVCQVIQRIVQPGAVCVDVGGYMGYMTLLMAKLAGEAGQVFVFEAHPTNAQRLRNNILANHMEHRVKVENMAVSDGSQSVVQLFSGREVSPAEWNIVGRDVNGQTTTSRLEVAATGLDNYFSSSQRIDFIKMDIEGAERQALQGMHRILHNTRPTLLIEFHDETGWSGREFLLEAGYRLYDTDAARWIDAIPEPERAYHCLAVPGEKTEVIALFN